MAKKATVLGEDLVEVVSPMQIVCKYHPEVLVSVGSRQIGFIKGDLLTGNLFC